MAKIRGVTHIVWGLFFLTGFSGLLYEVLWTRELTVVFGNTVAATSTVLAAYMGGLALGSFIFGRIADRVRKPLLLYGALEAIVAASALLFPLVLHASVPLLQGLYRSGHVNLLYSVRFLIAFLFLFIPTGAMGGSLPALGRLLARVESAGRILSFLYGVNTLGATLGTFCAGFWIIPAMGLSGALWTAVALNVAVAVASVLVSRWTPPLEQPVQASTQGREARSGGDPGDRLIFRLTLSAFLVSGALALALEVLWTRSLLLVFGSTVYSFTAMLGVFLGGLALGSAVFGLFVNRFEKPLWALGLVEGGIALVTLISISRVNGLPSAFLDGLIAHGFTWDSYMVQKLLIAAGILLPVSFLFGATFPIVARIEVSREDRIGSQVGLLYAFNTVGAIAGSLLAGFVLLPALGLQRSLTLVALLALALGVLLLLVRPRGTPLLPRLAGGALLAALGIGAALALPKWDEKILSAGVYFRPRTYLSPDGKKNVMDQVLGDLTVLKYLEGVTETGAVVETPVSRMFLVDGKVEAATDYVDMRLQRLMGHLPMLFAPRLGKVINIGLGCGITLGSLKVHPAQEIHCAELEPRILDTARYFAEQNHHVLDDGRLKVIINDGRNHLLLTGEKYDVITSDPFEPLVGGAASLYTEDHFRNGKARLTESGIFCQYLPMYQLSPADFQMIIRSFCRVFPHVSLWYTGIDTILLGSVEPHTTDVATLRQRMALPGVRESLEEVGCSDPVQLLQNFVMDPTKVAEVSGAGPVNTDGHPYIEFSAPRSHLVDTTPMNLEWLRARYRPGDLPLRMAGEEEKLAAEKAEKLGALIMEGSLARLRGRYEEAMAPFRKALALDPKNRTALFELCAADNLAAALLINQGKLQDAKLLLDEALATGEQELGTLTNFASWAFHSGDSASAEAFLKKALALNPRVPDLNHKMAVCLLQLGRPDEALPFAEKAVTINPRMTAARLTLADISAAQGDVAGAAREYASVLDGGFPEATAGDWLTLGTLQARSNDWGGAAAAFRKAARVAPSDPRGWYNLARVLRVQGDRTGSDEAVAKARTLAPAQVEQWLKADNILGP